MTRASEFTAKTRDKAFLRAEGRCQWRESGIRCEAVLGPGNVHYDHILPLALGGESSLPNCQCLCTAHHAIKTGKEDVPRIRKADRQRRAHIGAKTPAGTLRSRGFAKAERAPRRLNPDKISSGLPAIARQFQTDKEERGQ